MAAAMGGSVRKSTGWAPFIPGVLDIRLTCNGSFSYLKAGNSIIFMGESDSPYAIELRNRTKERLEVVASVDGLDTLEGKPANYSRRGYSLERGGSVTINGFRSGDSGRRSRRQKHRRDWRRSVAGG